jgi:opacity protein-like surface antigen
MKRCLRYTLFAILAAALPAVAQVAPSAYSDAMPDQITFTYIHTFEDYSLQTQDGLDNSRLNGVGVEYDYRRYYPIELVASVRDSSGQPLAQHLFTAVAGVGYVRSLAGAMDGRLNETEDHWYERWSPFVALQGGLARTSSRDEMYLYTKPQTGFAFALSAGADYQLRHHWSLRPITFEDEYLPFGVQGQSSTYWNIETGIGYVFHWR